MFCGTGSVRGVFSHQRPCCLLTKGLNRNGGLAMSMTQTKTLMGESAAYGGFVDAVGGVTNIGLAVGGLRHTAPEVMVGIGTIVFGAALVIQGGTRLSEYSPVIFPPGKAAPLTG